MNGASVSDGEDIFSEDQQHLRWSHLAEETDPQSLHRTISQETFPFIRQPGGKVFQPLKNALYSVESPATLRPTVELVGALEMRSKDFTGDLYRYMPAKLTTSGTNGQLRTPTTSSS